MKKISEVNIVAATGFNLVGSAVNGSKELTQQPLIEARRLNRSQLVRSQLLARSNANSEIIPWGVKTLLSAEKLGGEENPGTGKVVFIIDSGVSDNTGDLNLNRAMSRSWIKNESPFSDGLNHGTHVAGTIAALRNGKGVVGIAAGAEVISLKVVSDSGEAAPIESYYQAIQYAIDISRDRGLDPSSFVINFSMGAVASEEMESAVRQAADQGIRIVVSAGNNGTDVDGRSPANAGDHVNVYTVSAVDRFGVMPDWSNWDDNAGSSDDDVDLSAPGVDILSYGSDGGLITQSGTSMAAAHVSGALLIGDALIGTMSISSSHSYVDPILQAVHQEPKIIMRAGTKRPAEPDPSSHESAGFEPESTAARLINNSSTERSSKESKTRRRSRFQYDYNKNALSFAPLTERISLPDSLMHLQGWCLGDSQLQAKSFIHYFAPDLTPNTI